MDATIKLTGEGFKRPWPAHIKFEAEVKLKLKKISDRSSRPKWNLTSIAIIRRKMMQNWCGFLHSQKPKRRSVQI